MDALKQHAESLRATARKLLTLADQMDPPAPPVKSSAQPARMICPDCGTEYAGPEYRNGDPCLTVGCVGLVTYKADLVRLKDGRTLDVTVQDLAYQQAVRDFVCGGTDEVPGLDIATTYRGGRAR
jgi:hypothetical protein